MPALRRILFAILLLSLLSAAFSQTPAKKSASAKKADAGVTLHALFDSEWEYNLEQSPLFASTRGDRRWNDKLGDVSLASAAKDLAHTQATLQKLAAIDRAALTPADQLNYDLAKHALEDNLQEHKFRTYLLAVDEQNGGVHTLDTITELLRFSTAKDFQDWTARLNAYPLMVDQTIEVMREGIRTGIMPSRLTMARIPTQIGKRIVSDPTQSDYYAPFKNLPKSMPEAEQKQLAEAGRAAVETKVIPALRKFDKFFTG